eukprot:13301604-Alexandrium_andersonii.AAC.1
MGAVAVCCHLHKRHARAPCNSQSSVALRVVQQLVPGAASLDIGRIGLDIRTARSARRACDSE